MHTAKRDAVFNLVLLAILLIPSIYLVAEEEVTLPDDLKAAIPQKHIQRIEENLDLAGDNATEILKILDVFKSDREKLPAAAFVVANMPFPDLGSARAQVIIEHIEFAFKAREAFPWARDVPTDVFYHYVLPYRASQEPIEPWRSYFFYELAERISPIATMKDVVLEVNRYCAEHVKFKQTEFRDQGPFETLKAGYGRCEEMMIVFICAARSVGIPARSTSTPWWPTCDNNHAWVEVWADGAWHYLGACEPAPTLDEAWFRNPARRAAVVHSVCFGEPEGEEPPVQEWAVDEDRPGSEKHLVDAELTYVLGSSNGDNETMGQWDNKTEVESAVRRVFPGDFRCEKLEAGFRLVFSAIGRRALADAKRLLTGELTFEFRLVADDETQEKYASPAAPDGYEWLDHTNWEGEYEPLLVGRQAVIPSSALRSASVSEDESYAGCYSILISFTEEGAQRVGEVSAENIDRRVAIVWRDFVVCAPMIRERLPAEATITGQFTKEQAEEIRDVLLIGERFRAMEVHLLDEVWFRVSPGRHRVEDKPADIIYKKGRNYAALNTTGVYSDTCTVNVRVLDADGKPVSGCPVAVSVFNYGALRPISRRQTDEEGYTCLTLGIGDMFFSAGREDSRAWKIVSTRPGHDLRITLRLAPGAAPRGHYSLRYPKPVAQ